MASALEWVPDSLYNMAISSVVKCYPVYRNDVKALHDHVQFDIYYELYKQGRLCDLGMEFCNLETFSRVLKVGDNRHLLHHCFQALMDHGTRLAEVLANAFAIRCGSIQQRNNPLNSKKSIEDGFALGNFLSDAGWFLQSERVFVHCLALCKLEGHQVPWTSVLECYSKLLHVRFAYAKFREAAEIFWESVEYVTELIKNGAQANFAALFTEYSSYFFVKSHYNSSYYWSIKALKHLNSSLPPKTIVDVLRQAAKACVLKREFRGAELLIKQAVDIARECFGCKHPKYADTLLDYGFFLLNVDLVAQSVRVYQKALHVRQFIFGGKNLHVAIAHEDLAYASYVLEYSTGNFSSAKEHADRAMEVMNLLLPGNNLLLASSKRIKALILEELAIDSMHKPTELLQLQEAHDLHLAALKLARDAFGEMNVHTAKHYGNLGRLYQSMNRFKEAEEMHLKAISIKEHLLGTSDYEVALSVGHLASLYNYDMAEYDKAEMLYLRSIAIGKKLFGEGYSGLEYDYRGLLKVYSVLEDYSKVSIYASVFNQWKLLRDSHVQQQNATPFGSDLPRPLQDILFDFFNIGHADIDFEELVNLSQREDVVIR